MKFLIAGLGNIGAEYANTRHNIGFKVADALALSTPAGEGFHTDRLGDVATIRIKGHTIVILKPSTYMNLSGRAVAFWLQKEKIEIGNLLVISDDIALPFGTLRLRKSGSDGGHNGLKDIQATLNTDQYARLRIGVGGEFSRGHQVDYVIGEWSEQETQALKDDIIPSAVKGVQDIVCMGVERAMNFVNTKKSPK